MTSIADLEQAFRTAQAATEAYSAEVAEKYRQEFPPEVDDEGKEQPVTDETRLKRAMAWTEAERAELDGSGLSSAA